MPKWKDEDEGMKPWDYPQGKKPTKPMPGKPKPAASRSRPTGPTGEAEETAKDLMRRNRELKNLYGEGTKKKKKKKKNPGVTTQDAGDALASSK